ncbi:MAG TPA: glycosyltransferase [Anaerolineales bacterium]|nr:glycosyltransferase [Anaerolineales bacterium]
MKTITLLTSGTRGDVLPYMALGLGLRAAGYNVRIAAPIGFKGLIEPSGLTFAPFEGNPSDLMVNQGNPLTLGRSILHSVRATLDFLDKASKLYGRMLHTAANACRGSDVLLYGLATLWGAHMAEGLSIPGIRALLQPMAPTRQFSSALLPFRFSFLRIGNWLSHWIVTQAAWLACRDEINQARRTHLKLPRAHWFDPSLRPFPHQPLTLNGFSEEIVPRPHDWNEKQIITGYWRSSGIRQPRCGAMATQAAEISEQQVSPSRGSRDHGDAVRLQNFIGQSPQNTIAIGLGSPGTRDFVQFMNILDHALKRSDSRAVLTIPSQWHDQVRSKRICPIAYVPHDWLYQHVRVAVHHGGAGTTSASLHAGIPTVTLPLAIDQFFWAERVYKMGVGPRPVPQRSLNADKLANAIQQALSDKSMYENAKRISEVLCLEDGVQAAVRVIREVV